MIIISAPKQFHILDNSSPKIFLAGCANNDWRKDFVTNFDGENCIFYDPKRDDYDKMTENDMTNQIIWEYQKLNESDIIVFHFNSGSLCPITLLEYGMWGLRGTKDIAVYITSDYEKRKDLVLQTVMGRPSIKILDNYTDLIDKTKLLIMQWWYDRTV